MSEKQKEPQFGISLYGCIVIVLLILTCFVYCTREQLFN